MDPSEQPLTLTVQSPGRYGLTAMQLMEAKNEVELRPPAVTLRGTVVDTRDQPMVGAHVEAILVPTEDTIFATKTDANGHYELYLPDGLSYLLIASKGERPRVMERVEAKSQEVDLTLLDPPSPRPSDAEIDAWLASDAHAITTLDPSTGQTTDLEPLIGMLGGARIIGLGEVTHGTREIVQVRHRIIEALAERGALRAIALETGHAQTEQLNQYVRTGKGDPTKLVRGLVTTPFETQSFLAMIESVRKLNQRRAAPIILYGADVSSWKATRDLIAFLDEAKLLPENAREILEVLSHWSADGTYAALERPQQEAVRKALDDIEKKLTDNKQTLIAKKGKAAFRRAQAWLRAIRQAEHSYRDPVLRDTLMAENIKRFADEHPGRIAVWMHNAHITKAPNYYQDLGRRLERIFRDDGGYVAMGTAFGEGTVGAMDMNDPNRSWGTHRAAPPAGLDAALSSGPKPAFFVDLRQAPAGPVRKWLSGPVTAWSIGSAFKDVASAQLKIVPRESFDIVVYVHAVHTTIRL